MTVRHQYVIVGVRDRFARWARERGLTTEDGERYHGALSGVPIAVESGARDSGVYDVVVDIAMAVRGGCGAIVRPKAPPTDGPPLFQTLAEVAARHDGVLRSIRVDEAALVLRFAPDTLPELAEDAAEDVIRACRTDAAPGLYR
jgi:hypothetical protein